MPELVTCPHCGLRTQMAETALGKPALRRLQKHLHGDRRAARASPSPPPKPRVLRLVPEGPEEPPPAKADRSSRCPGCHRPVGFTDSVCDHCGRLLGPGLEGPSRRFARRDSESHRAPLLDTLGSVALAGGVLSVCLGPIGSAPALILGGTVWFLAEADLRRMATGEVDPAGEDRTRLARNKSAAGMVLGVVLTLVFFVIFIVPKL